jgi:hypothetical protein
MLKTHFMAENSIQFILLFCTMDILLILKFPRHHLLCIKHELLDHSNLGRLKFLYSINKFSRVAATRYSTNIIKYHYEGIPKLMTP